MITRINENLVPVDETVHCDHVMAEKREPTLHRAVMWCGEVTEAGPGIRGGVPAFVRVPVEFRQTVCPGCFTVLLTQVVAVAEVDPRQSSVGTTAD